MRMRRGGLGFIVLACLSAIPCKAASLRVAPTTLDLVLPASAATLSLRNEDRRPLNVQIRVFRWTQSDGLDHLEPTSDIVASPPAATLGPDADYVVRIVRMSKAPVASEECYRVVVDELPDPARRQPGKVNLLLRYSIPVFFGSEDATQPQVSWSMERRGGTFTIAAHNTGQKHLKISNLQVKSGAGHSMTLSAGLVGYVLGNSSMRWSWPVRGNALSGGPLTLSAQSDAGPINATPTTTAPKR